MSARILLRTSLAGLLLLWASFGHCAKHLRGEWVTPDGAAVVRIDSAPDADEWCVTVIGLREPNFGGIDTAGPAGAPRTDTANPRTELRSRPLLGLVIGRGFQTSGDALEGGRIYDPGSGRSYRATIRRAENGLLEVRGYLGLSLLGRTMYWTPLERFRSDVTAMLGRLARDADRGAAP